jgi:uncharacterized membrane protein YoaK (UPF0700 family)
VRRVGREVVHTTYVTSLLTSLGEAVAQLVVPNRTRFIASGQRIAIVLALWGGYVLGAAFASVLQSRLSFGATGVPLVALAGVIVIDARQPHELGEAQ